MDWQHFKVDRFAKLMALAFSTQENEASSALRMAARMLREAGGTFDDIADVMRNPLGPHVTPVENDPPKVGPSPASQPKPEPAPGDWVAGVMLERLARAEARVSSLTSENEIYKKQLDDAIKYIVELEVKLSRRPGGH
ncbi:MAG: hypothetical protein H7840_00845 [Alphaproteobacteria bacterium]